MIIFVLGLIGWIIPTIAGIWYLMAFKEMRDEIKLIRRYLQAAHERQEMR